MDYLTCATVNGPFAILNTMANLFYVFCMVHPHHGEMIKQPLKLLLGSIIFCSITYQISAVVLFFVKVTEENVCFVLGSYVVYAGSLSTTMTSSVWLTFFYCTQIVPAQTTIFTWIKKNIKQIIYCIWLGERVYTVLDVFVMFLDYLSLTNLLHVDSRYNITVPLGTVYVQIPSSLYESSLYEVASSIVGGHFFLSLCIMVFSCGYTVAFLCAHLRRMAGNGLSCRELRSQVRVTVGGILLGFLYLLCAMWTLYKNFTERISKDLLNQCNYFTVVNLYMTCSTLTLGAGQSVFRRKMEDVWLQVVQSCKGRPQDQHS